MTWIHPLAAETEESADVLGGKAHRLVVLRRLGLPVPPGFVIGAGACRAFLRDGRLPDGLDVELAAAVAELEAATGRPLAVSVRCGGRESMPGMMTTVLNLPVRQVEPAVVEVLSSWDTPRARTYRELHGIPHHLGTAVTVQAMVFGNRDNHSGSGVAFSRNPNTGEHGPFGEVLFGRQGDDVVSGRSRTRLLRELADREPAVWAGLLDALDRVEDHYRDACYLELTFEAGAPWLLQARPGRFAGHAGVRVATDLADEGVIGRGEALLRVSTQQLQHARIPRIATVDEADVLARGLGAASSRPPPVRTCTDCSDGPTRSRAAPGPPRGRTARRGPGRPRSSVGPRRPGPVLVRGDRGRGWPARGCGTPPAGRAGRPGA